MLSQLSKLEYKIADKVYHFMCDQDAPLEHVKECLFQFSKYIGQVEDTIKQAQILAQNAASEVKPVEGEVKDV